MNTYKYWTILLRKKGQEWSRPDKAKSGIQADPFLIKYKGENYLFYEKANPISLKGYLVCKNLDAHHSKPRVILKEPFHLSYPNVFCINENYYMIPESKQNHKITLYKAVEFPWKWEPFRDLLHADAVDTTCVQKDGQWYFYTYIEGKLQIYTAVTDETGIPLELTKLTEEKESKRRRPGGNFILDNGEWFRPAQVCENFYGEALVFCRQNWKQFPDQIEEESQELRAEQFAFTGLSPIGIHTYNEDGDYEVVDLYCEQGGIKAFLKKLVYIPLQIIYEKVRH